MKTTAVVNNDGEPAKALEATKVYANEKGDRHGMVQ